MATLEHIVPAALFHGAMSAETPIGSMVTWAFPMVRTRSKSTWLLRFVDFILGKRAFTEEMAHDSPAVSSCRARIYAAADPLLHRAQNEGKVRKDVVADDVLRMLSSIALGTYPVDRQMDKVVAVALSGLLLRPVALNMTTVGGDVPMGAPSIS
jgi:hypothetical protein